VKILLLLTLLLGFSVPVIAHNEANKTILLFLKMIWKKMKEKEMVIIMKKTDLTLI
tara:strand:+ start:168 stop:335 length:168 start_codon:yes stop_codon:yes gene_type:complete